MHLFDQKYSEKQQYCILYAQVTLNAGLFEPKFGSNGQTQMLG